MVTVQELYESDWIKNTNQIEIGAIAAITTGCTYLQYDWPVPDATPVQIIDKMGDTGILLSNTHIQISERENIRFTFKANDIILNHRSSPRQLGKSALFNLNQEVLHTKYLRIRTCAEYDSRFLMLVLQIWRSQGRLLGMANISSRLAYLLLDDFKRMNVPLLSLEEQIQILALQDLQLHAEPSVNSY